MALATLLLAAAGTTRDIPVAPVLILMALGILIAIAGHLSGSRTVVGMGLFVVFLATAAMIVGGFVAFKQGDTDPRQRNDPSSPSF